MLYTKQFQRKKKWLFWKFKYLKNDLFYLLLDYIIITFNENKFQCLQARHIKCKTLLIMMC